MYGTPSYDIGVGYCFCLFASGFTRTSNTNRRTGSTLSSFYEFGSAVATQIDSSGTQTQRTTYQMTAGTLRITLPNGQTNIAVIESLTATELILAYGDTKEYYKRIG